MISNSLISRNACIRGRSLSGVESVVVVKIGCRLVFITTYVA